MKIVHIIIELAIAVLASAATAKACASRWGGSFAKLSAVGCTLSALITFCSILLHGLGIHNIQAVILSCAFLYASYGDIKTHEADDFNHIIVLAAALITRSPADIPESLLTAAVIVGVMLIVTVFVGGAGIGGADMRFCAACAFLGSFSGGLLGLLLGLFVALLFNSPFRRKEEGAENKGFPMLPYLSCSYMLVYLLSL